MKKLIIAAAIVCAAAFSHAASVYWTATNVYLGNTTDLATGIAYFMTTDTAATSAWTSGLTVTQVKGLVDSSYSYTPVSEGRYSISKDSPIENAVLGLNDATTYTAYLVIFDGTTIDSSTKFYMTRAEEFDTYAGTSSNSVAFGNQRTNSQNPDNWTAMAPEPTSGLLLLFGMGVLALRRKRA